MAVHLPRKPSQPVQQDLVALLAANQWLTQFPRDALVQLAAAARRRRFSDGEEITGRNKQPEGLALVLEGAIRDTSFSEDGRETAFSLVQAGSLWGIVAVLDGAGAVHHTYASGKTELLVLPTPVVMAVFDRWPVLYRLAVQMLCYRLRKAYSAVDELALASLRQRLARQLCTLATVVPGAPAGQRRVSSTQDELAMLIGATRPSVNRQLAALEREGLIQRQYGGLTVLDYEGLHRLCATHRIFEL